MASKNKVVEAIIDDNPHIVLVPEDATEELYSAGILLGPPMLKLKGVMPTSDEILQRLQLELYNRGLFNYRDVSRRRADVYGAFMAAIKLDVEAVIEAYHEA